MKLYRYEEDFGRMGSLDGMFFATDDEYTYFMGKTIWENDILGKHSQVQLDFDKTTVTEVKLSQTTIDEMFAVLGSHISGISPMDYFDQWQEEDEESDDE